MKGIIWVLAIASVLCSCSGKKGLNTVVYNQEYFIDTIRVTDTLGSRYSKQDRADVLSYLPDMEHPTHTPLRNINMNFHFVYDSLGQGNFPLEETEEKVMALQNHCNNKLSKNIQMNLPVGNETPVYPIHWRYKPRNDAQGKYIYHDIAKTNPFFIDKGKTRNHYQTKVIKEFAIDNDSVLNVFIISHHADSAASPTYRAGRKGIALGTSVKVAGLYHGKKEAWKYTGIINHEIGHVLGLRHAWTSSDGCDDTPKHKNKWQDDEKGPASNNMMDYNNFQQALTPCQIGKVMRGFATLNSKTRKLLETSWCEKKESMTVVITDSILWAGDRDLEGDIIVKDGGILHIACRVSLPKDAFISVEPGGKLILDHAEIHNSCGDSWQGIKLKHSEAQQAELVVFKGTKIDDADKTQSALATNRKS